MISLVMQPLKELELEGKDLVDLILLLFQIFLKTFLGILMVELTLEDLIIEETI